MRIEYCVSPQLLVHSESFNIAEVKFDFNTMFTNKPRQALWTSTAIKEQVSYSSAWLDWCSTEEFNVAGHNSKYLLIPKESARVVEVSNYDDVKDLPFVQNRVSEFDDDPYIEHLIDFKMLSMMVDGLHFTHKTNILSWYDCESTVWFNVSWIDSLKKLK